MMVAKKIGFVFSIFFILIASKVWLSPNATTKEIEVNTANSMPPYLMQLGFLTRTPRGRCVTRKAYEHLHMDFVGQEQLEI